MYTNKAATLKLDPGSVYSNSLSVYGSLLNKSDKYQINHQKKFSQHLNKYQLVKKEDNTNVHFAVFYFEFNRDCVIEPTIQADKAGKNSPLLFKYRCYFYLQRYLLWERVILLK